MLKNINMLRDIIKCPKFAKILFLSVVAIIVDNKTDV